METCLTSICISIYIWSGSKSDWQLEQQALKNIYNNKLLFTSEYVSMAISLSVFCSYIRAAGCDVLAQGKGKGRRELLEFEKRGQVEAGGLTKKRDQKRLPTLLTTAALHHRLRPSFTSVLQPCLLLCVFICAFSCFLRLFCSSTAILSLSILHEPSRSSYGCLSDSVFACVCVCVRE